MLLQMQGVFAEYERRIVKIFELAFLLKVTPLSSPTLRLVFRPTLTDTHGQYGW